MVLPEVLGGFAFGAGMPCSLPPSPLGSWWGALVSVSASVQVPTSLRPSFLWPLGCHL